MQHRTLYASAAILLLTAGAVVELLRVVLGWTTPELTEAHGDVISVVLAVLWGATALTLAGRHRHGWTAIAAWVLSIASTFAVLAHAFLLRVAGAWDGGVYLAAAPILAFLLWKTLRGGEYRRLRHEARQET
jgi:hypothetical protein